MKALGALMAGALGALVAMSGSAAAATTLFSDLGPGQSYSGSSIWMVAAPNIVPANAFVAAASGSVSEIDIALKRLALAERKGATVSLWTDASGGLGAELGSWTVSSIPLAPGSTSTLSGDLVEVKGISGIELTAGDTYFLQVAADGEKAFTWQFNNQGVSGVALERGSLYNANAPTGAFEILSAAGVPEPATWAMLIVGVAMVGFAARRRTGGTALAA